MSALDIGVYGARGVPSTYSGYETFLTTLLPELALRGHTVTAYCRDGDGIDGSDWNGIRRVVLPAIGGKNLNTLSHGLVAALAARRARHDVVLVVNVANAAYTALGRLTGQPVVLNTDGQEWERGKWGRVARGVFRASARIAGRCATGLVTDCRAMHDVYVAEFASPSTVIPYCPPDIDWEPDPATPRSYGLEPDRYLVIAGRHNPENNIDRVAQLVVDSEIPLPLLVLGTANYDSPVTARLHALAARDDRIVLGGHVACRNRFLDLVHHAAAYVHGHSVGGINPSILEAMHVGARVIALDTPFNREALGETGRLFDLAAGPSSPGSLASAIADARSVDSCHAAAERRVAAERIASTYPVKAVADAYESVLVDAAVCGRATGLTLSTRW